jgi:hypothetical protein
MGRYLQGLDRTPHSNPIYPTPTLVPVLATLPIPDQFTLGTFRTLTPILIIVLLTRREFSESRVEMFTPQPMSE